MNESKNYILIDGMPSSGKKTISSLLTNKRNDFVILPQSEQLKKQINIHWQKWNPTMNDNTVNIITTIFLEVDPDIAQKRNNSKHTKKDLIYLRYKYRQYAGFYGNIHLIDTSLLSVEQTTDIILSIINDKNKEYFVPQIDSITDKEFDSLPLIIDSCSKIVRKYNEHFHIVRFKPNVYSFIKKGVNKIPDTDTERTKITKYILEIISRNEIPHTYLYVGEKYILNKSLYNGIEIPPIETIVKKYLIGSDKHNYYNITNYKTRFGRNIVKNESKEYNKLMVRFDYRNPEYNPDTKKVLGDFTVCDDLADEFINVKNAKKLVTKCFNVLDSHFTKMNLTLYDICLMVTVDGNEIYAEISQDCSRLRPSNCEKDEKLKEIWCTGGSKEEYVLIRYKYLTNTVEDYVNNMFNI